MDRLEAMAVFLAILDHGSLAGAGRALSRSPAAVARAVASLERHAGAALLERTTRAIRPTEAGALYAGAWRVALAALDEANAAAAARGDLPQGVLTLVAPAPVGDRVLLPILEAFLANHPAVSVRLAGRDRRDRDVAEPDVTLHFGRLPDSTRIAVKVADGLREVLVAAPAYLSGAPALDRPTDLVAHDLIAAAESGLDRWTFPGAPGTPAPLSVAIRPRIAVETVAAAIAAARTGLGIARVHACHVAADLDQGRLQIVLPGAEPPPTPAYLVVPAARAAAPRIRAFLDHAAPRLRKAFAALGEAPRAADVAA